MFAACNKEKVEKNNLNVTVPETVNIDQHYTFKNESFPSFQLIRRELEGQGTFKLKPEGYVSYLPPSDKYEIWIFEDRNGKISEFYVFNRVEDASQVAITVQCDKRYHNEGGTICCDESGSQCRTVYDECGNVCIILCIV
jgi:hypothetical protein